MLATHGYNNIITCTWSIWNNTKNSSLTKSVQLQAQSDVVRPDDVDWLNEGAENETRNSSRVHEEACAPSQSTTDLEGAS